MKTFLSCFFLLSVVYCSAQPVTELHDTAVYFRLSNGVPQKTEARRKADSSLLSPGYYKTINGKRGLSFQVNDSGRLDGSLLFYQDQECYHEIRYTDGLQSREYVYLGGKTASERFDSVVTVLMYDSNKKNWLPQLKKLTVEKEYNRLTDELRIRFEKGPYNSYADYRYKADILVREIIPHCRERKMDTKGNLQEQVFYNWELQQIETTEYKNGRLCKKTILKNPFYIWEKKGTIAYLDKDDSHSLTTTMDYYDPDHISRKTETEAGKQTVTEYDRKGKIISRRTIQQAAETDATRPVEIKQ